VLLYRLLLVLFTSKLMSTETQQFWDKHAKKYEDTERKFDPLFKHALAITKKHLNTHDVVLDFGCATGVKTLELAASTKHIHGLGYSVEMVKEANRKKLAANIINCSFSHGTIFTPSLHPASFDKIVSFGVLHLLEDPGKEIKRIAELLKPGGLFISTTPVLKERIGFKTKLELFAYQLVKKLGFFPLHLNMLTTRDVETVIQANGFQIVESQQLFLGITVSFVIAKKTVH
jgi:2-polyprenyl-3-methyl-5-hydroxy-6-metoxy-1,4-benzoquinol methylase